jgi:DUF1365 family protein
MKPVSLMKINVKHRRFSPKPYEFKSRFFWFHLDLVEGGYPLSSLVSYNRRGLYSFYDSDHIKLGKKTARDNYIEFAKRNGFSNKIDRVEIFTQLRFFNYVFNPVSFIIMTDKGGMKCGIIEIGNTFNELKPYYIPPSNFEHSDDGIGFEYETDKYFYISPFIQHDTKMLFKFKNIGSKVSMYIRDSRNNEKILDVCFKGELKKFGSRNLIVETLINPFVTGKIIFLIHFHALILWIKRIRYYKKSEFKELQKGALLWKP